MAPSAPATLDDLGIQGCLHLAALLTAQERRVRIAPTRRHSLAMLQALRERDIIAVPWPDARWEVDPTAEETPLEKLQWRYTWTAYVRADLLAALEDFLEEAPFDEFGILVRMRLWQELTASEAERFLETQLTRHHFEASWAEDVAFVIRESGLSMPIAQWRYCCWAATRFGASLAVQHRGTDIPAIREGIYSELRRRAQRVANGDWGSHFAFAPFQPVPESAASRLFTQRLTRLRQAFWTLEPSHESLIAARSFPKASHAD